ncbi:MAG: hypothetical protein VB035_11935 [Candidatus Fimivivens sp.]|nr:hypothetical protein [Candidatus Fimivivens sp.]
MGLGFIEELDGTAKIDVIEALKNHVGVGVGRLHRAVGHCVKQHQHFALT